LAQKRYRIVLKPRYFRSLQYNTTTNIYTGSIGWYTGNGYLSVFRPYFTRRWWNSTSYDDIIDRKYRSDADNFFAVTFGMGFSPEINQFNFGGSLKTQ
jgi:YaiO family outer membrane protein